eukprot:TRINITY_DN38383_c0_g1_i2.p1 TRINITY_DN38383_c0_g1~~TRINITY_DN38383_c0_g1_i2.p1  ORF type:complete len:271 (-),score=40.70 TRINITY_DN38383_c0_g1_i2:241-1053(-)
MSLLDEALCLEGNGTLKRGKTVLVKDCVATSGAFILHYLVKKGLYGSSDMPMAPATATNREVQLSDAGILFVGLKEPFSHYDRILRKLGCNLSAYRKNGQFVFLDMSQIDCNGDTDNPLYAVYKCIYSYLEKIVTFNGKTKSICIMIDDVSLLEIATYGHENHVLDFLHYCCVLTSKQGCSLVLLAHQDIYANLDNASLIQHMEHFADIVINVKPLSSGLAADVHGQLTIFHRSLYGDAYAEDDSTNSFHHLHFQVKENQVDCFLPGRKM